MIVLKKISETFSTIARLLKPLAVVLLILSFFNTHAGLPEEKPGSRAAGLAFSTAAFNDGWSLFHNQGGIAFIENIWVGAHHENRFLTPELSFSAIGALLPVKYGTFGLSIKRLGFSQFNQTKIGLAYGMKLTPTFSAGVQLNAHHVYFAGVYGSTAALTAEGGFIYSPNDKLNIGFHIINPTRTILIEKERIPTLFNLGISYQIGEMVLLTSGVEKNIDKEVDFKAGLEFEPIKNLAFRTGVASNPSLLSFGLGYKLNAFQMDFAFSRHEMLGYTPHFSVSYIFGYPKTKGAPESITQ
jgi:hypothetical protein